METTTQNRVRYRASIATTSKGMVSFDVTAEVSDPEVSQEDRDKAIAIVLGDAERMIATLAGKYGKAQEDGIPVNVILDVHPRGSKGGE